MKNQMGIKSFYQKSGTAFSYDTKRFSGVGGRYVNATEMRIVDQLLADVRVPSRIVDIAAGTGRFSMMLAKKGHEVTAVDSSEAMLAMLNGKAQGEGLNIHCQQIDARELPLRDSMFDAGCSLRFMWHYAEWIELVEKVMLMCHGPFIFDLMSRHSLRRLVKPVGDLIAFQHLVDEEEAESLLETRGFRVMQKAHAFAFPYIVYRKLPFLTLLLSQYEEALCRRGHATMIYFMIKKA